MLVCVVLWRDVSLTLVGVDVVGGAEAEAPARGEPWLFWDSVKFVKHRKTYT